jgi:hypothetical protein
MRVEGADIEEIGLLMGGIHGEHATPVAAEAAGEPAHAL